jgi:hypothetical protein
VRLQFPAGFAVMRRFRFACLARTARFDPAQRWRYWLKRIAEIRERVIEALARVDAAECVEIGGSVGANVHV